MDAHCTLRLCRCKNSYRLYEENLIELLAAHFVLRASNRVTYLLFVLLRVERYRLVPSHFET